MLRQKFIVSVRAVLSRATFLSRRRNLRRLQRHSVQVAKHGFSRRTINIVFVAAVSLNAVGAGLGAFSTAYAAQLAATPRALASDQAVSNAPAAGTLPATGKAQTPNTALASQLSSQLKAQQGGTPGNKTHVKELTQG